MDTIASAYGITPSRVMRSGKEGHESAVDVDGFVSPEPGRSCLLLLDSRTLDRECLAKALIGRGLDKQVIAIGSIDEWNREKDLYPSIDAVLFNIGGRHADDPFMGRDMAYLQAEFPSLPIVVLSDSDELSHVLKMLEHGARGFIPSSVGVAVCIEALSLAMAGGIFIPASAVQAMRHLVAEPSGSDARCLNGMFTPRQEAVLDALRKGKANKIIAYELNLRESTVKVHIRNIMKKLNARNRTEVAYKLNDLFYKANQKH
ncbi:DNA-binding NarL/FixJ family response regulator [Pseudorhizobium tarimense]|uniref:DNA-binding NarL/FixJ family response regulator n=1 Tax=Pseudorhizobium tarimense TaxID=1079109 RepID=A0ABV2H8S9_9HYPH|nr:response regulator transcription factor [Pseudorhizobium tarimense]MCJ8519978.1 response regulator transcription factor [Pseudorhizobium tarimense]